MKVTGWGDDTTKFFFELTPDRVLAAVEASGLRCTGYCQAMNSFENRVYEVELELDERPAIPSERFRIVKFYRPGRWSREQILDEHAFLWDLKTEEVPAIAPEKFADGDTLKTTPEGIHYAIFPKQGGRAPSELTEEELRRVGRLVARIHTVGARRPAPHRIELNPTSYGLNNLDFLLSSGIIPPDISPRYEQLVREICTVVEPWFAEAKAGKNWHRLHGDCHLGNLLQSANGFFFVDFDDMLTGPAVQDLWLVLPSRERQSLELMLEGYEEIRDFDRRSLRLIEALRALRFIHYTGWIARRWADPAFPRAFPQFGSPRYWKDETEDLEKQWAWISENRTSLDLHPGNSSGWE